MTLRTLHAIFEWFLQCHFECTLLTSRSSNIFDITLTIVRNKAKRNSEVISSSLCMYAAFPFVGDSEVRCGAGTGHALNASSLGTSPSLNYLLRCGGPRYPKTVKTWEG